MKRALVPAVIALGLAVVLVVQLVHKGEHDCRVCVSWRSVQRCASARGGSEAEATRAAQDSACSLLAHGVSDAMNCPRVEPDNVSCK